jgi:hypothetical protein
MARGPLLMQNYQEYKDYLLLSVVPAKHLENKI